MANPPVNHRAHDTFRLKPQSVNLAPGHVVADGHGGGGGLHPIARVVLGSSPKRCR